MDNKADNRGPFHQEKQPLFSELLNVEKPLKKKTDKHERILQSAVEVFAERGYAAASTSEIARRAGVSEGTIFRHYKTKQELLHSIMVPVMAKFILPASIDDFIHVLDAKYEKFDDFLRAIVLNRLSFARKNLPMVKIMLQEIPFQNELRKQFLDLFKDKILSKLVPAIAYFQERGDIRPLPPFTIIRLIVSVFVGYMLSSLVLLPEGQWDDNQEIDRNIGFIMNGLSLNNDR
ncbi:MAG: TetR/AcrR family transcriptional regulator [Gorillibacterium sp.]|nr:TetR/AcrR family transcriptional regulator [Gorillibacterium sp.]